MPRAQKEKPAAVETIGQRVAQARRLLGVTSKTDILPADLARMIGVQASTVTRIENGERQPGEALVVKLADALNVTPAWLRYGIEIPEVPIEGFVPATSEEKKRGAG